MAEKKNVLKSGRCFLVDYFNEKDIDLFVKMAKVVIRCRLANDDINLNHVRNLYKRLLCLVYKE